MFLQKMLTRNRVGSSWTLLPLKNFIKAFPSCGFSFGFLFLCTTYRLSICISSAAETAGVQSFVVHQCRRSHHHPFCCSGCSQQFRSKLKLLIYLAIIHYILRDVLFTISSRLHKSFFDLFSQRTLYDNVKLCLHSILSCLNLLVNSADLIHLVIPFY